MATTEYKPSPPVLTREEDLQIQKEMNYEWTIGELREDLERAEKKIEQLEKDKSELIDELCRVLSNLNIAVDSDGGHARYLIIESMKSIEELLK